MLKEELKRRKEELEVAKTKTEREEREKKEDDDDGVEKIAKKVNIEMRFITNEVIEEEDEEECKEDQNDDKVVDKNSTGKALVYSIKHRSWGNSDKLSFPIRSQKAMAF
jgi:hypothetical protein